MKRKIGQLNRLADKVEVISHAGNNKAREKKLIDEGKDQSIQFIQHSELLNTK